MTNSLIKPTVLRGTRDFLPNEMLRRNAVIDSMRQTFERFGYAPIETPIICPAETIINSELTSNENLTYTFHDHGQRLVALPYDLTVPFARFVARHHNNLPMPFKRYQIQRVWRAEKPQYGRQREFSQCDIDIIGSNSLLCEAEILRLITLVFSQLTIAVSIRINSRRLISEVLNRFAVPVDKQSTVLRLIDKLHRDGVTAIEDSLKALGILRATELVTLLQPADDNATTLAKFADYDLAEINELFKYCQLLNIPQNQLVLDPSLTRGLNYYTGIVFEAYADDEAVGAISAGGRYDDLCNRFSNKNFSGVGVSFGLERILLLLERRDFSNEQATSKILLTQFSSAELPVITSIFNRLIDAGIAAEIFFDEQPLSKQMHYAAKKHIPFVLIVGPDEVANDTVIIKHMHNGRQKTLPNRQIVDYMVNFYEAR